MAGMDFSPIKPRRSARLQQRNQEQQLQNKLQFLIEQDRMQQMQQQRATQGIGSVIGQVEQQFPGGFPAGAELNIDESGTRAKIPLNRELTGDELSAISAKQVFPPIAKELKQKTKSGVFNSKLPGPFQNIGRTFRQFAVGQPNALLTSYDESLQSTQGKINSIRRYVFGEGGKQLTPYEAKIVNALITPLGKSDIQYQTDLDEAIKIIESKAALATGGLNAAFNPMPGASLDNQQQGINIEQERDLAKRAIASGKNSSKVAEMFRQRTGQEL